MAQPVFYDPRKARWKRIRLAFDVIGVSITLLVIFFAYTALRDEPLPDLLLAPQKRPYHALKEKEKEKAKERRKLATSAAAIANPKAAPSQVKLNAGRRHPRGILRALRCCQFFVLARICPADRSALSRLAARHHAGRPAAEHRRTDQQVFRRDAETRPSAPWTTKSCRF